MSMEKEAYRLANEIGAGQELNAECLLDGAEDMDMEKYRTAVLGSIRREKKMRKKKYYGFAVAACAACAVLVGTAAFGDQVHAAIRQISWSIGNALGISADLEAYREVVNTSVSDQGYVITLQEAVVSEDKLVVNYTIQREDGQSMGDEILVPNGTLCINGKAVHGAMGGSAGFIDEEQKVVGEVDEYHISGDVDLTQENEYVLSFDAIGNENEIKGKWEFAFTADGADLIADTVRAEIEKEFQMPDGTTVTLHEFTSNRLEQRITFSQSADTRYMLMVMAEDQSGHQAEFGLRTVSENAGYMQNEDIVLDGRVDDTAGPLTLTLFAVELPEQDGQISDDYVQVGEPFELGI